MSRPRRLYLHMVARKYGQMPHVIREQMTAEDFEECIAYEYTQSQEWLEEYEKEKELEASRKMDNKTRDAILRDIFRGR